MRPTRTAGSRTSSGSRGRRGRAAPRGPRRLRRVAPKARGRRPPPSAAAACGRTSSTAIGRSSSRASVVKAASSSPQAVIQSVNGAGIEVDVQRVAVRGHPARDVDADGAELARGALEPDAREAFDPRRFDAEGRGGADDGFLEVAAIALDVPPVAVEVEDRVADELARPVEGRLAAAVGLYDLDLGAVGHVQLLLVRPPAERDDRRVLDHDHRVGDRALRDGRRYRALEIPRLQVRRQAEIQQVARLGHATPLLRSRTAGARGGRAGSGPQGRRPPGGGRT